MRFSRTAKGRLQLDLLDGPDFAVARAVSRAIATAFSGKLGLPLNDVDGSSWLDIDLMGGTVTVHVQRYLGISVFAADEASDGIIYDIANYLGAHAGQVGIDPKKEFHNELGRPIAMVSGGEPIRELS